MCLGINFLFCFLCNKHKHYCQSQSPNEKRKVHSFLIFILKVTPKLYNSYSLLVFQTLVTEIWNVKYFWSLYRNIKVGIFHLHRTLTKVWFFFLKKILEKNWFIQKVPRWFHCFQWGSFCEFLDEPISQVRSYKNGL